MDKSEKEELDQIRGTIITIMGTPKNPHEGRQLAEAVSELSLKYMTNVEIGELHDTPVITLANLHTVGGVEEVRGELMDQPPILRAASAAMTGTMLKQDEEEDAAREAAWEAMSEEEQEAVLAARAEKAAELDAAAKARDMIHREEDAINAVSVAEAWIAKPDLTVEERCHGVAYDLFRLEKVSPHLPPELNQRFVNERADDYAMAYDKSLSDKIRERKARSAKELFGR